MISLHVAQSLPGKMAELQFEVEVSAIALESLLVFKICVKIRILFL